MVWTMTATDRSTKGLTDCAELCDGFDNNGNGGSTTTPPIRIARRVLASAERRDQHLQRPCRLVVLVQGCHVSAGRVPATGSTTTATALSTRAGCVTGKSKLHAVAARHDPCHPARRPRRQERGGGRAAQRLRRDGHQDRRGREEDLLLRWQEDEAREPRRQQHRGHLDRGTRRSGRSIPEPAAATWSAAQQLLHVHVRFDDLHAVGSSQQGATARYRSGEPATVLVGLCRRVPEEHPPRRPRR